MTETLIVSVVYGVQVGNMIEERHLVTPYWASPYIAKKLLKVNTPEASPSIKPHFVELLRNVDKWLNFNVYGYTHQCGIEWVKKSEKTRSRSNNSRSKQ